jgi:hypothetical protein
MKFDLLAPTHNTGWLMSIIFCRLDFNHKIDDWKMGRKLTIKHILLFLKDWKQAPDHIFVIVKKNIFRTKNNNLKADSFGNYCRNKNAVNLCFTMD